MSSLIKHFYDLCGGNIQTKAFNELPDGSSNDFDEDAWADMITPSSGNKLVIFGLQIQAKAKGKDESGCAFKVGDYYIGDFWVDDTAVNFFYPFSMNLPVPAVGAVDAAFKVYTKADTGTLQPSVVVTYGEFTP